MLGAFRYRGERRKGISPVIATILLIGVTVFAVGVIFMFTQTRAGELQNSGSAPQSSITIDAAAQNTDAMYCGNNNGIILVNNEGDTIEIDKVQFSIKSESDPTPIKVNPRSSQEWEPGMKLGVLDINREHTTNVVIPDNSYCSNEPTEGNNHFNTDDTVSIVVSHRPTGKVLFEGSTTAISQVNSFIS